LIWSSSGIATFATGARSGFQNGNPARKIQHKLLTARLVERHKAQLQSQADRRAVRWISTARGSERASF
jgi:hypothetical protein